MSALPITQSLKARLWFLGLISALGVVILAGSSIWHVYQVRAVLTDFVDQKIAINRAATSSYANGLQMGQALRNILLDPANQKGYENFAGASEKFGEEVDRLTGLLEATPAGAALATKLKANIGQWQPHQKEIIALVRAGDGAAAQGLLVKQETPAWRAIRTDLLDLVKSTEQEANQQREELLRELASNQRAAILISLCSFILVAITVTLVGRGIFHQVGGEPAYADEVLQQIADGDLSHEVHVQSGDHSSIIAALSRMQGQLTEIVGRLGVVSTTVAQTSQGLAASVGAVSRQAQEQSDSTSEMAASIEEMTVSISHMAESAASSTASAQTSRQIADQGRSAVGEATGELRAIAASVTQASALVEALHQRSEEISKIVGVIKEIADQTNLLALNAAIEAARAGDQGRGFAVVADEVRKLAERTSQSTQVISEMLAGVQQATREVVVQMADSNSRVKSGAEKAESARAYMERIGDGAGAMVGMVGEISDSLREQSQASTLIAQSVERIAQMTEQTTSELDRVSHAAQELDRVAVELKDAVGVFRV